SSVLGFPDSNTTQPQHEGPILESSEYSNPSLVDGIHLRDGGMSLKQTFPVIDYIHYCSIFFNYVHKSLSYGERKKSSKLNFLKFAVSWSIKIPQQPAMETEMGAILMLQMMRLKPLSSDAISLPEGYDPASRFISLPGESEKDKTSRMKIGTYWEILEALPADKKESAKDPQFLRDVVKAVQAFRTHFQYNIRSCPSELLEEFTHTRAINDFKKFNDSVFRASSALCRMLSGYNETAQEKHARYPDYPPIICKEVKPGQDPVEGFFQLTLPKILVLVLFGVAQVKKEQFTRPKICHASHWGVTEVTPGMIASAAVGARYMISPDKAFAPVGPQSGIDWTEAFQTYKQFLSTRRNDPPIVQLFDDLNATLFGDGNRKPTMSELDEKDTSLGQATATGPNLIPNESQKEGTYNTPNNAKFQHSLVFKSIETASKIGIEDAFKTLQRSPLASTLGDNSDKCLTDNGPYSQDQSLLLAALDTSNYDPVLPALSVGAAASILGPLICPNTPSASKGIKVVSDVTSGLVPNTQAVDDPNPGSHITATPSRPPAPFSHPSTPSATSSSLMADEIVPAELARVGRLLWSMRNATIADESDKENEPPAKRRKGEAKLQKEKEQLQAQVLDTRNQLKSQMVPTTPSANESKGNSNNTVNDEDQDYDPSSRLISSPNESESERTLRLVFGTYWEILDALPPNRKDVVKDPQFWKTVSIQYQGMASRNTQRILIAILFGVDRINKARPKPSRPRRSYHWNFTEITPAMIASAAVGVSVWFLRPHLVNHPFQARFMVSPDRAFTQLFDDLNASLFQDGASVTVPSGPDGHELSLSGRQATAANLNSITDRPQEGGKSRDPRAIEVGAAFKPEVEDTPWAPQVLPSAFMQIGYSHISPTETSASPNSDTHMSSTTSRARILDGKTDIPSEIIPHAQCLYRPMLHWPITDAPNHSSAPVCHPPALSSQFAPSAIGSSPPIDEIVPFEPSRVGRVLRSSHKAVALKGSGKENKRPNRRRNRDTQIEKRKPRTCTLRARRAAIRRK
ncbi:9964_t:CDS:10, partial [Acaulospora colombiana]